MHQDQRTRRLGSANPARVDVQEANAIEQPRASEQRCARLVGVSEGIVPRDQRKLRRNIWPTKRVFTKTADVPARNPQTARGIVHARKPRTGVQL